MKACGRCLTAKVSTRFALERLNVTLAKPHAPLRAVDHEFALRLARGPVGHPLIDLARRVQPTRGGLERETAGLAAGLLQARSPTLTTDSR
jgi:hypothetical protein